MHIVLLLPPGFLSAQLEVKECQLIAATFFGLELELFCLNIRECSHNISLPCLQVGDLSKEVSRRVLSGEYDLEDVILAFRYVSACVKT